MEKIRQANENTRSKRDKLEEDISKLSEKIKDEQVAIQLKQSEFKDAKTCAEDEKIRLERFQQEENKVRLRKYGSNFEFFVSFLNHFSSPIDK